MGSLTGSKNIHHRTALHHLIPRNREVTVIGIFLVGGMILGVTYPTFLNWVVQNATQGWDGKARDARNFESWGRDSSFVTVAAWIPTMLAAVGIGAAMGLAACIASMIQGGIAWDWGTITANWDRVSPGAYAARTWNLDRQLAIASSFSSGIAGLSAACLTVTRIYPQIFLSVDAHLGTNALVPGILGNLLLWTLSGCLAGAVLFSAIRTLLAFRTAEVRRKEDQMEQEKRRVKYRPPRRL